MVRIQNIYMHQLCIKIPYFRDEFEIKEEKFSILAYDIKMAIKHVSEDFKPISDPSLICIDVVVVLNQKFYKIDQNE